jgi:hypothetical protein
VISKNLTVKGLCGRCLSEFIDWRYSQSCWYFRPSFLNYCPFNLLSSSPPPPLPKVKVQQIVCGLEVVGGCWVVLQTIFCRILTFCFWPDSEPTNLLYHPKQNHRRGGGLRQINTCRKVPQFFCSFCQCNLSRVEPVAVPGVGLEESVLIHSVPAAGALLADPAAATQSWYL